jgi:hypothetical protein
MHPINKPEVMLSDAAHNVDEKTGDVTNEQTVKLIGQLLEALSAWTLRLQGKP